LQIVIFRFATGFKDAAFRGFVNTFDVTRKPFRSKDSGCAMATFLEAEEERGNKKKKEAKNGRKSGPSATRRDRKKTKPAWHAGSSEL